HAAVESMLCHNKNYLGCVQGHKSPFHHKEEVAMQAFDARVTALFYCLLLPSMHTIQPDQVNNYIRKLNCTTFTAWSRKYTSISSLLWSSHPMGPSLLTMSFQPMQSSCSRWRHIKCSNTP